MSETRATLIAAVRADVLVGKGSCASIDECMEDDELWTVLTDYGTSDPTTITQALKRARDSEEMYLENGTNQTSGEPDCPIVAEYRAWKKRRAELERAESVANAFRQLGVLHVTVSDK